MITPTADHTILYNHRRRVRALCRRSLLEYEKGKRHFDVSNVALNMARAAGLKVGERVEVELCDKDGQKHAHEFELVDNTATMEEKGVIYRPARVPKYELKEVPKSRRGRGDSPESPSQEAA